MEVLEAKNLVAQIAEAQRVLQEEAERERLTARAALVQEFDALLSAQKFPEARVLSHRMAEIEGRLWGLEVEQAERQHMRDNIDWGELCIRTNDGRIVSVEINLCYMTDSEIVLAGKDLRRTALHILKNVPTMSPTQHLLTAVRGG